MQWILEFALRGWVGFKQFRAAVYFSGTSEDDIYLDLVKAGLNSMGRGREVKQVRRRKRSTSLHEKMGEGPGVKQMHCTTF